MKEKKCSVCKEIKSFDYFYNYKNAKDGKSYRCKSCDDLARQSWRDKNPERAKRSMRNNNLKSRFGITIEEYENIFKDQGSKCAICGAKENNALGSDRHHWNFAVDHCHSTGKIRGLLCNQCNRGLGMLGDTVESLEKALTYLKNS